MSAIDKAKNFVENATGKAKETAGKVTHNDSLKSEGKSDQTKSELKKAGENVKDAI